MNLFLVIDETPFYHPDFAASLITTTTDTICGAAIVERIPARSNIENYLKRNWHRLTPAEMFTLACRKYYASLQDRLTSPRKSGPFHSVQAVCKAFKIGCIKVYDSINKKEYVEAIARFKPDIIISSNSLIFGKSLLSLPSRCCLNRHSALLPSYGGVWPVFQAYRRGERFTGVSVHTMTKKIDEGIVLAHTKIPITQRQSLSELYRKCFSESHTTVLRAIDKIRNNDFSPDPGAYEPSYFSFPSAEHWKEFRKRGGRFV
jgi:methionyl-tRNA formyltransferase